MPGSSTLLVHASTRADEIARDYRHRLVHLEDMLIAIIRNSGHGTSMITQLHPHPEKLVDALEALCRTRGQLRYKARKPKPSHHLKLVWQQATRDAANAKHWQPGTGYMLRALVNSTLDPAFTEVLRSEGITPEVFEPVFRKYLKDHGPEYLGAPTQLSLV